MSTVIPEGVSLLTPQLSTFIRDARAYYGLSQEQVAARGGPRRQMQGWIENADREEVTGTTLAGFDCAYQWPTGYTAAVARNFFEVHGAELNPALVGDEADAAVLHPDSTHHHPHSIRKTLAAWRNSAAANQYSKDFTCLGFNPEEGKPVHQTGALLTNIDFRNLHAVFNPEQGTTIIDTQVIDDASIHIAAGVDTAECFSAGQIRPGYRVMKRIAVDPLTDLYDMAEARRLAQALMTLRPGVRTTVERAAFTFLAIAAFGGDPLVTITHLKIGPSMLTLKPAQPGLRQDFINFWQAFYSPDVAGPALAEPDLAACDLLAGVLAARDSALKVQIGNPHGGRRKPTYEAPVTLRSSALLDAAPAVVFYDSASAPELPTCIAHQGHSLATTFYRATDPAQSGGGPFTPTVDPVMLRRSIGIATAHDLAVLSQHDRERMGTLTNFTSGFAVYCDAGRARRVWIPEH
ncbi:helix-turn-helix domain-containing protein [Mycobacterium intracellulare]|uniref:helix-turn-helix domain-containing protein n=1 Tax=Mycobacterium intracellulare TaxID=1767 RepID=UPI001EEF2980|nr:helix-turn-helix domain-containing protein [Mycobacterium intracellulare]MEE3755231.1 helix-turn-helix domain-containing protein [Mycobacterium intracellulare]